MGPSGWITAKARQGFIQMGIRWWVSGGPGHRSLQGCRGSGFVQPALIVWNHCGGANDPDTRLRLFHQNRANVGDFGKFGVPLLNSFTSRAELGRSADWGD
jgi:hypothetical protein